MKVQPEIHSNSVMARFASFLGLKNRQERRLDKSASNASVSLSDVSLPVPSPFKDPKYSPLPSPLRSDFLRSNSSLSFSNILYAGDAIRNMVIEDDCERVQLDPLGQVDKSKRRKQDSSYTPATTHPLPVRPSLFPRHLRSRSLDTNRAHLHASNQTPFAVELPPPHSRSRSMDVQSRYGQNTFMDCSLRVSTSQAPPVIVPPNCVLVQVWAVGLDEDDRQLVVGSDGCVIDGAHNFKSRQETPDLRRTKCKEGREEEIIGYSIFNDPKLLGWSSDFWAKKKEKERVHGWTAASNVKPVSTSDQQTTQKYNGKRIAGEVSFQRLLEAVCFPGQSFVGRVLGVGSVVEKSFAARDDWVVGLVDIRKVSLLSISNLKLQSVDKVLVWCPG
jgi:hypothetical protein